MDYKKEIIDMVQKCTDKHWLKIIYTFLKKIIK